MIYGKFIYIFCSVQDGEERRNSNCQTVHCQDGAIYIDDIACVEFAECVDLECVCEDEYRGNGEIECSPTWCTYTFDENTGPEAIMVSVNIIQQLYIIVIFHFDYMTC